LDLDILLFGDDEIQKQAFSLKLMDKSEQVAAPFDELVSVLQNESKG